ncbi:unnamed protein product [Durusdinium trenchii]|uniref:ASCH domain-containing protein n=1 Tax=Durusdinium trenchii TaxID=1381693 RepID=A0ABP0M4C0_9DINO
MDVDIGADDVDPLDFVPVTSFTPDDGAQRQEADIRVRVKSLTLPLSSHWYQQIRDGHKHVEIRAAIRHWEVRCRDITHVVFQLGYNPSKRLAPKRVTLIERMHVSDACKQFDIPFSECGKLFHGCTDVLAIHFE